MSDSEDDRQQQGSNEQRQRQRQQEESEMRGGEAESGPTHNGNRPSRSGKMCGFHRPGKIVCMLWRFQSGLTQARLQEGLSVIDISPVVIAQWGLLRPGGSGRLVQCNGIGSTRWCHCPSSSPRYSCPGLPPDDPHRASAVQLCLPPPLRFWRLPV